MSVILAAILAAKSVTDVAIRMILTVERKSRLGRQYIPVIVKNII